MCSFDELTTGKTESWFYEFLLLQATKMPVLQLTFTPCSVTPLHCELWPPRSSETYILAFVVRMLGHVETYILAFAVRMLGHVETYILAFAVRMLGHVETYILAFAVRMLGHVETYILAFAVRMLGHVETYILAFAVRMLGHDVLSILGNDFATAHMCIFYSILF